jgi:hypothetical protein
VLPFLICALNGGEWSVSLSQGKSPWQHLDRRLSGPRNGLDAVEKRTISCPLPIKKISGEMSDYW